ncbi:MAG: hypothetical protein FRX49_11867 [Trebouxia sp. A1-2]|nr:MAG: hypothetical protein FRX49_11867 [Trebouxia sp. A1-2]
MLRQVSDRFPDLTPEQAVARTVNVAAHLVLVERNHVQAMLHAQRLSRPYQGFCRHLQARDAHMSNASIARDMRTGLADNLLSSTDSLFRYWFDDIELDALKDCFDANGHIITSQYLFWLDRPMKMCRLVRLLRFENQDAKHKSDWTVRQQTIMANFVANMSSVLDYIAKRFFEATPHYRYIPSERLEQVMKSVYFPIDQLVDVPVVHTIKMYATIDARHVSSHRDILTLVPARQGSNEFGLNLYSVSEFTSGYPKNDFSRQFSNHVTQIMKVRQLCHSFLACTEGELRAQGVQLAEAEVEDRSQQTNAEIAMAAFEKAPPHKNANFTAEAWATCIMHLECSDQDEAAKELNHIVNLCRSVLRKQELLDFELSVASSEKSELTEAVHQEINNLLRHVQPH